MADHNRLGTPLPYREGQIPERAITSRVPFNIVNSVETTKARKPRGIKSLPSTNTTVLKSRQLRKQLTNEVRQLIAAESYDALIKEKNTANLWNDFLPATKAGGSANKGDSTIPYAEVKSQFDEFKAEFKSDDDLKKYEEDVKSAMALIDENGLLEALQHDFDTEGGQPRANPSLFWL